MGLIVAWGSLLTARSPTVHCGVRTFTHPHAHTTTAVQALSTFVAARYLHTYSYANELQPHRACQPAA